MAIKQAIVKVLKAIDPYPMHYTKITEKIIENGFWQPRGETPKKSVNKCLNQGLKGRKNCLWKKVRGERSGMFAFNGAPSQANTTFGGVPQQQQGTGRKPKRPQMNYYPDERHIREGARKRVFVNKYERSSVARRRCIQKYGARCCVCGFSFRETYGKVVDEDFIHVHHVRPLSAVGKGHTDPVEDLRPVCPNCHAVIHSRKGNRPFCIKEVRAFLERERSG